MINTIELIERVKKVLKAQTQNEVAEYFKVSKKTVSEWKNGNSSIPFQRFVDLAESKKVSLNWLFFGVGKMVLGDPGRSKIVEDEFHIFLDSPLSENEREELKRIAVFMSYAPPYFIKQVVNKLNNFKRECCEEF